MFIVIPFLILGALALVFAIMLAIAGKKLAIKQDERVEQIMPLLTGANCGGCGQAGCEAFAKALVAGTAKPTDCASTAANKVNLEKICNILGSEAGEVEETIIVSACNGGNRCVDKYEYQGYGDCASIELLAGGRKACPSGCIGAANCSHACPYHAININGDGVPEIDREKCVKCGTCVLACPKKIFKRISAKAKVYIACSSHDKGKDVTSICTVGCIGCGLCAKFCEAGAITMTDGLPVFDYDKCTGCQKCVEKCPRKCIHTLS